MTDRQALQRRGVGRLGQVDAVRALTIFIVVIVVVPARLVIGPLGSAGTPAQVIALTLLAWWICSAVGSRRAGERPSQPLTIAMMIFVAAIFASYLAAALRPMNSTEARSADVAMLSVGAWLGLFLTATDGIPTRERLDTLLRRLVAAAGGLATLGIMQFATGRAYTNYIQIPGLHDNATLVSIFSRDDLTRPAGTTLHPIEFGAALTMCLPIALHYAFSDEHRPMFRRWYPVAAIAIAVPISISRSAIVSTVVVLCVLIPSWPVVRRRRVYLGLVGVMAVIYVTVPGLIGTIKGLFFGISTDSGTTSRTNSFPLAIQFIRRAPIFGRGFGTFLPVYRILDDGYLGMIVVSGFVGLAALLALFTTAVVSDIRIRQRDPNPRDRALAIALAASVASAAASFATFDAFGYPTADGVLFLLLGCGGALYRISTITLASVPPLVTTAPEPGLAARPQLSMSSPMPG